MKRITKKSLKELIAQYDEERLAKKRNVTFFSNYIEQSEAMLKTQKAWVEDKIERQDFSERFNEIGHDMQDRIESFINEIGDDCDKRNWTTSDYTSWSSIGF